MEQIKRGLRLFAEFFKIGCFTFGGGWAIVAQMEQEYVNRQKLITKDELLELVAVGRSTPGIMITNIRFCSVTTWRGLSEASAPCSGSPARR